MSVSSAFLLLAFVAYGAATIFAFFYLLVLLMKKSAHDISCIVLHIAVQSWQPLPHSASYDKIREAKKLLQHHEQWLHSLNTHVRFLKLLTSILAAIGSFLLTLHSVV